MLIITANPPAFLPKHAKPVCISDPIHQHKIHNPTETDNKGSINSQIVIKFPHFNHNIIKV